MRPYKTDWDGLRRSWYQLWTLRLISEGGARVVNESMIEFPDGKTRSLGDLEERGFVDTHGTGVERRVSLTPAGRKAVSGTTGWPPLEDFE